MATTLSSVGLKLFGLVMTVVGGLLLLVMILFQILLHPFTAFKKVIRNVPPDCLLDKKLGTHEYVTANGIKFHYVTAGDRSKPLMLFLHGFPEFWFSWRFQLPEFSKDYHVVAIDMRGYGETDRPPNRNDYNIDLLTQDVVELIPALGHSKCILVSHDWGGIVAWSVLSRYPQMIEKFIVMDCPHPKVYMNYSSKHFTRRLKLLYMFTFQPPMLPELLFSLCDYQALHDCFTKPPLGLMKIKGNITERSIEAYKYVFSQPGALTAALNYYRCIFNMFKGKKGDISKKIDTPVLIIWGDEDKALDKELADCHDIVASNITVAHIANCSHWVQQDAPDEVIQHMKDFLQK